MAPVFSIPQEDPVVRIDLDLSDETTKAYSDDDDENSLPEIFFKRIVVPQSKSLENERI